MRTSGEPVRPLLVTGTGVERSRLEERRRDADRRVAVARVAVEAAREALSAAEVEGEAVDVELGALDLRDSSLPEDGAEAVGRVRSLLAHTDHPVLDVLALPAGERGRASLLRVEFRFAGPRVGVLLARTDRVASALFLGPGRGVKAHPLREHTDDLAGAGAGDPVGVGEDLRDHASNDDVRAVAALPYGVREAALRLVRDHLREGSASTSNLSSRLASLLALTEHEGTVLASAEEASGVLRFLGDLTANAPAEWALRRLLRPGVES